MTMLLSARVSNSQESTEEIGIIPNKLKDRKRSLFDELGQDQVVGNKSQKFGSYKDKKLMDSQFNKNLFLIK